MIFNLDKCEINNYFLGSNSQKMSDYYDCGFYGISVEDGIVKSINIRLSEFYSKGKVFDGELILGGNKIIANQNLQPNDIIKYFDNKIDYWDDGVEVNYQFKNKEITYEFSWHKQGENKLIANYICIQLEIK